MYKLSDSLVEEHGIDTHELSFLKQFFNINEDDNEEIEQAILDEK